MAIAKTPSAAQAGLQVLQRILCEDLDDIAAKGLHDSDMEWSRRCPQQLLDCLLLLEISEGAGKWNNLDIFTRYFRSEPQMVLPALRCFRAVVTAVASLPLDNPFRWRWMAVVLTSGDPIPLLLDVLVSGAAAEADGSWRHLQRTSNRSEALARAAVEATMGVSISTLEDEAELAAPLAAARTAAEEALLAAAPKPKKGSLEAALPAPPGPEEVLEAARALRVLCEEVFHPMRQPQHCGDSGESKAQQALGAAAYTRAVACARQQLGLFRAANAAHQAAPGSEGGHLPPGEAAVVALREATGDSLSALALGNDVQDVSQSTVQSEGKAAETSPGESPSGEASATTHAGADFDSDGFVGPHFLQAMAGSDDAPAGADDESASDAEAGDIEGALMAAGQGGPGAAQVWGEQFVFHADDGKDSADAGRAATDSARERAAAAGEAAYTAGAVSVLLGSASECGRMKVGHSCVTAGEDSGACTQIHTVLPSGNDATSGLSGRADFAQAMQRCLLQPGDEQAVAHVDMCGMVAPPHPARRPLLQLLESEVELVGRAEEQWCATGAQAIAALLQYSVLPLHCSTDGPDSEVPAAVVELVAAQLEAADAEGGTVAAPLPGCAAEYTPAQLAAARAHVLERKIRSEGVALLSAMTYGGALTRVWHGAGALPGVLAALKALKGQLAQAVLALKYGRLREGQRTGLAPKSARSPRAGSRSKSPASPKGGSRGSGRGSPRSGSRRKSRGGSTQESKQASDDADRKSASEDDIADYSLPAGVHFDDVPGPDTSMEDALRCNYSAEAAPAAVAAARTPEERFMLETTTAIEAGLNAAYRLVARSSAVQDAREAMAVAQRRALGQFQQALETAEISAATVRERFQLDVAADEAAAAAALGAAADSSADGAAAGGKKKKPSAKDSKGKKGANASDDEAAAAAAAAVADAQHRLAWLQMEYGAWVPQSVAQEAAAADCAAAAEAAHAAYTSDAAASTDASAVVLAAGPRVAPPTAHASTYWAAAQAAMTSAVDVQHIVQGNLQDLALISAQFASCPWDTAVCGVIRAGLGVLRALLSGGSTTALASAGGSASMLAVVKSGPGIAGLGDSVRIIALERARVLPCLLGLLRHPLAGAALRDEAEATMHMLIHFNEPQSVALASPPPGIEWSACPAAEDLKPSAGQSELSKALGIPEALAEVLQHALRDHPSADGWFDEQGTMDVDALPVGALASLRDAIRTVAEGTCAVDNPFHPLMQRLHASSPMPDLPGQQLAAWRLGGQAPLWPKDGVLARCSPAVSHIAPFSTEGVAMDMRCILPHADTDGSFDCTWLQWAAAASLNAAAGAYQSEASAHVMWCDSINSHDALPTGRWAGVAGIMSLLAADAVAELAVVLQGGSSLPASTGGTAPSKPHKEGAVPAAMGQAIKGVLKQMTGETPQEETGDADASPGAQLPALRMLASVLASYSDQDAAGDAMALSLQRIMEQYAPGMHSLMLRFPDPHARGADAFPPPAVQEAVAAMDATLDSGKGGSGKKRRTSDAAADVDQSVDSGVATMRELCVSAQRVLAGLHGVPLDEVSGTSPTHEQLVHVKSPWVRLYLRTDMTEDSGVDDGFVEAALLCALFPTALPPAACAMKAMEAVAAKKDKKKAGKDKKKAFSKGKDGQDADPGVARAVHAAARVLLATQQVTVQGMPWHQDTLLRGQRLVHSMLQGITSGSARVQRNSAAVLHVLAGAGITPLLLKSAVEPQRSDMQQRQPQDNTTESKDAEVAESGAGAAAESVEPVPRIAGLSQNDLPTAGNRGYMLHEHSTQAAAREASALAAMSLSLLLRLSPLAAAHMSAAAATCVPLLLQRALGPEQPEERAVHLQHALIPSISPQGAIAVPPSVSGGLSFPALGGCSNVAQHVGCQTAVAVTDLRHCFVDLLAAISEADSLHRVHGTATVPSALQAALAAACSSSLDSLEAEGAAASLGSKKGKGSMKGKAAGKSARGGKSGRGQDAETEQPTSVQGTAGADFAAPSWSPGFVAARALGQHLPVILEASTHAGVLLDLGVHTGAKLLVAVTALLRVPGVKEHMLGAALDKCKEPWWQQVQELRQRMRSIASAACEHYSELTSWLGNLPLAHAEQQEAGDSKHADGKCAGEELESKAHEDAGDIATRLKGFEQRALKQRTVADAMLTSALQCVLPNDIPSWALASLGEQAFMTGMRGLALPAAHGTQDSVFAFGGPLPERPSSARRGGKGDKSPRGSTAAANATGYTALPWGCDDGELWASPWSEVGTTPLSESEDMDAEWLQGAMFDGAFSFPSKALQGLLPSGVSIAELGQAAGDAKKGKASPRGKAAKKGKGDTAEEATGAAEWLPLPALIRAAGGVHGATDVASDAAAVQLDATSAQAALVVVRMWHTIQTTIRQAGAFLACVTRSEAWCPFIPAQVFSLTPSVEVQRQLLLSALGGDPTQQSAPLAKGEAWDVLQKSSHDEQLGAPEIDTGARIQGVLDGVVDAMPEAVSKARTSAGWGTMQALQASSKAAVSGTMLELLLVQGLASQSHAKLQSLLAPRPSLVPVRGSSTQGAVGTAHPVHSALAAVGVLGSLVQDGCFAVGSQPVHIELLCAAALRSGCCVQLLGMTDPLPPLAVGEELQPAVDLRTWLLSQTAASQPTSHERAADSAAAAGTALGTVAELDDSLALRLATDLSATYARAPMSMLTAAQQVAMSALARPTGLYGPLPALDVPQAAQQAVLQAIKDLISHLVSRGAMREELWRMSQREVSAEALAAAAAESMGSASRSLKSKAPSKKGKDTEEVSEAEAEPVFEAHGRPDPLAGPTTAQWALLLNQAHESARYPRAHPPQHSPDAVTAVDTLNTGFFPSLLTPLHAAIMAGCDEAVKLLLGTPAFAVGAQSVHQEEHQTLAPPPPMDSCWPKGLSVATSVCTRVSVLVRDCRGRSPAALALSQGLPHLAMACLFQGGDLESMDDRGHNLLKYALLMPERTSALHVRSLHEGMPSTACTPFPLPLLVWGRCAVQNQVTAARSVTDEVDTTAEQSQDAASTIQALARGRAARRSAKLARHMHGLAGESQNQAAAAQIQALARGRAVRRIKASAGALQHTSLQLAAAAAQSTQTASRQADGMAGASMQCSPALQVSSQCLNIFQALVEGGADLNVSDARGNFPLHWAAAGTSLQQGFGSMDCLILSCRAQESVTKLLEYLLSPPEGSGTARCRLDAVNKAQETAMHGALAAGFPAAALLLLQAGAHPNISDCRGNLPLHYCALGRGWVDAGNDQDVQEVDDEEEVMPPDVAQPLTQLQAHGRQAEVFAALLDAGQRFSFAKKEFSDPRRGLSPAARAGLDTHARLQEAFRRVVHPDRLSCTSASVSQLLCVQNAFGMTPVHAAAAGSVTSWQAAEAALASCGVAPVPASPIAAMGQQRRLSNLHQHARSLGSAFDAATAALCCLPMQGGGRTLPLSVVAGAPATSEDVDMFMGIAASEAAARAAIMTYALSLPQAAVTPDLPGGSLVPLCLAPALHATTGGGVGVAHFMALSWNMYARLAPQGGVADAAAERPQPAASQDTDSKPVKGKGADSMVDNPLYAGFVEIKVPSQAVRPGSAPSDRGSAPSSVRYYLQHPRALSSAAATLASACADAEKCLVAWSWGGQWERPQVQLSAPLDTHDGTMQLSEDVTLGLTTTQAGIDGGDLTQPSLDGIEHPAVRSWHRAYLRMLDAVTGQGMACLDAVTSPIFHATQEQLQNLAAEKVFFTGAAVHATLLQLAAAAWRPLRGAAAQCWGSSFDAQIPLWAMLARGARVHPHSFDEELQQAVQCFPGVLHCAAAAGCSGSLTAEFAIRQSHEELIHVAVTRVDASRALHSSISDMRSSTADAPGHMTAASAAATLGASRAAEREVLLQGSELSQEDTLPAPETGVSCRSLALCEQHELLQLPFPRWNALNVSVPPSLEALRGLLWTPLSTLSPQLWCTGGAMAVAAAAGEVECLQVLTAAAVTTGGHSCQVLLGDGLGVAAEALGVRPDFHGGPGLGWNALHAAAAAGNTAGLEALVQCLGVGTLAEMWQGSDAAGHMPLAYAIVRSEEAAVKCLLLCMSTCSLEGSELTHNDQPQGTLQEATQVYGADLVRLAACVAAECAGSKQDALHSSQLGQFLRGVAFSGAASRIADMVRQAAT